MLIADERPSGRIGRLIPENTFKFTKTMVSLVQAPKVGTVPPSLVGVIAQEEKSENVYLPQLWLALLPESRYLQVGQPRKRAVPGAVFLWPLP
jgi:hypothetical protein